VFFTVVSVAGATAVYVFLYARVRRPYRVYVVVALIALLLSLAPDFALTQVALTGDPGHSIPQASWAEAALLMAMHIATAALCITLLPRLPLLRRGTRT
jgi:DMSO reductase anchor subunit